VIMARIANALVSAIDKAFDGMNRAE
jgi:hypothetical protein